MFSNRNIKNFLHYSTAYERYQPSIMQHCWCMSTTEGICMIHSAASVFTYLWLQEQCSTHDAQVSMFSISHILFKVSSGCDIQYYCTYSWIPFHHPVTTGIHNEMLYNTGFSWDHFLKLTIVASLFSLLIVPRSLLYLFSRIFYVIPCKHTFYWRHFYIFTHSLAAFPEKHS